MTFRALRYHYGFPSTQAVSSCRGIVPKERRLTAILAADVVGYSRLMEATRWVLSALKSHRDKLINPRIADHHGGIVKLMGDGALAMQRDMAERNAEVTKERRIDLRIGVHLGDVIVEGEDIYGDGVNVAARLEGLSEPGRICISQQAFDQSTDAQGVRSAHCSRT